MASVTIAILLLCTSPAFAFATEPATCAGTTSDCQDATSLMQMKVHAEDAVEAYSVTFPLREDEPASLLQGADILGAVLHESRKKPSFFLKLFEKIKKPREASDGASEKEHCAKGEAGSIKGLFCEVPGDKSLLSRALRCLGEMKADNDEQEMDFFQCSEQGASLADFDSPAKVVHARVAPLTLIEEQREAARQMAEVARRLPDNARLVVPPHLLQEVRTLVGEESQFIIIGGLIIAGVSAGVSHLQR